MVLHQLPETRGMDVLGFRPGASSYRLVGNTHVTRRPAAGQTGEVEHLLRSRLSLNRSARGTLRGCVIIVSGLLHRRNDHCGAPGRKGVLATGTVKAAVAAVLLVLRLRRRDVLQAIEAKVRIHFVAEAETASEKGYILHYDELLQLPAQ